MCLFTLSTDSMLAPRFNINSTVALRPFNAACIKASILFYTPTTRATLKKRRDGDKQMNLPYLILSNLNLDQTITEQCHCDHSMQPKLMLSCPPDDQLKVW